MVKDFKFDPISILLFFSRAQEALTHFLCTLLFSALGAGIKHDGLVAVFEQCSNVAYEPLLGHGVIWLSCQDVSWDNLLSVPRVVRLFFLSARLICE